MRPVKLRRVVLGYDCRESWTEFRFDLALNYRLPGVIANYSENKPTLVSFIISQVLLKVFSPVYLFFLSRVRRFPYLHFHVIIIPLCLPSFIFSVLPWFQVFVSTRKAAQSSASTLAKEVRLIRDAAHKQLLTTVANGLRDNKLRGNTTEMEIVN